MLTFHEWKNQQVKADSEKYKVFRYYRSREWYWSEYSKYCDKIRDTKETGLQS